MKAYICDRCRCTYTTNTKHATNGRICGGKIAGIAISTPLGELDSRSDLCDDCIEDLFKFMNNNDVLGRNTVMAE